MSQPVKHVTFIKKSWTPPQIEVLVSCCRALVNNGSFSEVKKVLEHFNFEYYKDLPEQVQRAFPEETWKKIFTYLRKRHITCLEILYIYSMYKSNISLRDISKQVDRSYVRVTEYCKLLVESPSVELGEEITIPLKAMIHHHATVRDVIRSLPITKEQLFSYIRGMRE